jgi:tetratricopeptide (TPR) repeat protein
MLEIALALRAVSNNRVVWTQSYAAEAAGDSLLSAGKIPEFVNQAIEAMELWLSRNSEDEQHCASRMTLSAAHRAFCLGNMDLTLAQSQLEAALDLDGSVVQLGWLAFLECVRVGEAHSRRSESSTERVRMLTAKALQEDRGNSLALALLGHANAFVLRDYAVAEDLISESLRINPHRAAGWDARAMLNFYTGDLEDGYVAAQRARALGRFSPYSFWYEASCGIGASMLGRHAEAIRHGSLVLAQRPDFKPMIRHMLASFALQGDKAEAQKLYRHWQVLEEDISIAKLRDAGYPVPNPDSVAMIEQGLIKAGVALAPA